MGVDAFKAANAIADVMDEAQFAHLAVADHVHAGLDLLLDDLCDCGTSAFSQRKLLRGIADARLDQLDEVIGPRQAAGVGRKDALCAALHPYVPGDVWMLGASASVFW